MPLLSYVLLRGRCGCCKAHVSARYPAVEALTAFLFAATAYKFGVGYGLLSALVLISTLITLAATDLEHRLLPNVIVGPATLVGFALSVLQSPERWWLYLLSTVAVAGGLLVLAILYPGGMGMGDVKMGGMLGVFLGPYAALAVFLQRILLVVDKAGWHTGGEVEVPEGIHLEFPPSGSPELQPAERLWPLTNEAVANRLFEKIGELEEALVERCVQLLDQPEIVRNLTNYHWWPQAA